MAMFAKTQTKMMLNWLFNMTAKKQNNTYENMILSFQFQVSFNCYFCC